MDKECVAEITYVKPIALDLGALEVVYGLACPSGNQADERCTGGFLAGGGSSAECNPNGSGASCTSGEGAST